MLGALAGAVAGGALGLIGANKANKMNRDLSREQMAFQEDMSNTAYQRAVADMKKAGLNPAVAYQQGGASAPSGSMATMTNPVSGIADSIQTAYSNSTQRQIADNTVKVGETQVDLNKASESQINNSAENVKQQAEINKAEAEIKKQEADFYKKNPSLLKAKIMAETAGKVIGAGSSALNLKNILTGGSGAIHLKEGHGVVDMNTGEIVRERKSKKRK